MLEITKRRAKKPKVPQNTGKAIRPTGYQTCTALHSFAESTFVVKAPFAAHITLDDTGKINQSHYSQAFGERLSSIEDAFSVDFNLEYTFFCEEPLTMLLTPPYLHQINQSKYGFVCSAGFDISSWFRPVVFIYQLWPGVKEVGFEDGEALAYITFQTDRKVILKQYKPTNTIRKIAEACVMYKGVKAFQPLYSLYARFHRVGLHKRLLEEIKSNLL
jgi:hypothetical protein